MSGGNRFYFKLIENMAGDGGYASWFGIQKYRIEERSLSK